MDELKSFTERMHPEGPFYGGKDLGYVSRLHFGAIARVLTLYHGTLSTWLRWVDVMIAPWAFRAANGMPTLSHQPSKGAIPGQLI